MTGVQEIAGRRVKVVGDGDAVVADMRAVADLIGDAMSENVDLIVVPAGRLAPEFFRLRSRFTGEVLQKLVNDRLQLAVIGDLSGYTEASAACRDRCYPTWPRSQRSSPGRHARSDSAVNRSRATRSVGLVAVHYHKGMNTPVQDAAARVRARLEAREAGLSPFAARGATSRGRERPEPPPPLRTEYQRDRDRVLHSNAFRRLKHKTQVFIAPTGDHYVTRMTHTLEVAQIARTIARALNLNEDLAEAASLGHDIGHAPFGHAGETAISQAIGREWRHNEHGLRVVERLAKSGRGLNLTWETREAIVKSSKIRADIFAEAWGTASTLEGQIVKVADAVAYMNHDIEDAIRAGLLREEELPAIARERLGCSHHDRIQTLVTDIVATSWAAASEGDDMTAPAIAMSAPVQEAANTLREFLFGAVYLPQDDLPEVRAAIGCVCFLVSRFRDRPDDVPEHFGHPDDGAETRAVDYVAGMTDRFALRIAADLGCADALRASGWGWRAP